MVETIDFNDGTEVTREDVAEYRKTATVRAGPAIRGGTIPTLEGEHTFEAGDFIAGPGPAGEFWPIKRAIFEATYVPVGETDGTAGWHDLLVAAQAAVDEFYHPDGPEYRTMKDRMSDLRDAVDKRRTTS